MFSVCCGERSNIAAGAGSLSAEMVTERTTTDESLSLMEICRGLSVTTRGLARMLLRANGGEVGEEWDDNQERLKNVTTRLSS